MKAKGLVTLVGVCLLLALAGSAAMAVPTILNPGFEVGTNWTGAPGTDAGWQAYGTARMEPASEWHWPGSIHTGRNSWLMSAADNNPGWGELVQARYDGPDIMLDANTTYLVSAWVAIKGPQTVKLGYRFMSGWNFFWNIGGAPDGLNWAAQASGDTAWTQLSFQVTTGAAATPVILGWRSEFAANQFPANYWDPNANNPFTSVDDWAIVAVPEPASLLALGSGLMGLLGLARRRRS